MMESPTTPPRHSARWPRTAAIAAVALAALGLGMVAGHFSAHPPAGAEASPEAATKLQALILDTPAGRPVALAQWQGKVRVLNFWATWCPPCRQEIPALSRIQEKMGGNGVQLVGIAVDSQENIRDFAAETQVSYPLLVASPETVEALQALGNRQGSLPFTVILDRQGQIRYARAGSLNEEGLERLLTPLLHQ